jgi:hypothetical protein
MCAAGQTFPKRYRSAAFTGDRIWSIHLLEHNQWLFDVWQRAMRGMSYAVLEATIAMACAWKTVCPRHRPNWCYVTAMSPWAYRTKTSMGAPSSLVSPETRVIIRTPPCTLPICLRFEARNHREHIFLAPRSMACSARWVAASGLWSVSLRPRVTSMRTRRTAETSRGIPRLSHAGARVQYV